MPTNCQIKLSMACSKYILFSTVTPAILRLYPYAQVRVSDPSHRILPRCRRTSHHCRHLDATSRSVSMASSQQDLRGVFYPILLLDDNVIIDLFTLLPFRCHILTSSISPRGHPKKLVFTREFNDILTPLAYRPPVINSLGCPKSKPNQHQTRRAASRSISLTSSLSVKFTIALSYIKSHTTRLCNPRFSDTATFLRRTQAHYHYLPAGSFSVQICTCI